MVENQLATSEECRPLFDLMGRVYDTAPWRWMQEMDLFGVQHPNTGEVAYVSVMGAAGEHYAVAAYLGARGLQGFWHMHHNGPNLQPKYVFTVPQLQASWEDRTVLEKHDYRLIKSLGLKYHGRSAWPQFRSVRPGYAPWYIEKAEARFLQYVLEQLLVVAPRARQQPDLLHPPGKNRYLVRIAQRDGDTLNWQDRVVTVGQPPYHAPVIEIDPSLLAYLKRLPRAAYRVEVDLFLMSTTVGEHGERPYFPYVLMMLDATHDFIIGLELLEGPQSIDTIWGHVGLLALQQFTKVGQVSTEIRVRDHNLYKVLKPMAKELNIEIKHVKRLPVLDRARRSMDDHTKRY